MWELNVAGPRGRVLTELPIPPPTDLHSLARPVHCSIARAILDKPANHLQAMVAPTWSVSAERLVQDKVGICDRIYEASIESTQRMTPEKTQRPGIPGPKAGVPGLEPSIKEQIVCTFYLERSNLQHPHKPGKSGFLVNKYVLTTA